MIDRAKLQALSLETLTALRESISDVIKEKMRSEICYGTEVEFAAKGERIRMFVTNFGPKNLLGYRIDQHGNHLRHAKWRVSPSCVTVVPKPVKPTITAIGGVKDRPASMVGAF